MNEAVTTITTLAQSALTSETTVSTIDDLPIAAVISSAINSSADETDKLSTIFTVIGQRFTDMIPALVSAAISLTIGIIVSKLIVHVVKKIFKKSKTDKAAASFLISIIKMLLYSIFLIIALSIIGVPMTSLIAVLSAAGLAIGLALRNSLSNLAGGFIILINKPFKAGQYIETNSASGYVERISILYTKIRTLDNKTVYIPNDSVTNSTLTNYSEKDKRRIDIEFGISYEDDLEFAKSIIIKTAEKNPLILKEPIPPFARLMAHGEDSLIIRSEVWTNTENYWQVYYDMPEQVYKAFVENGISIPYRQMDIHIKNDSTTEVTKDNG